MKILVALAEATVVDDSFDVVDGAIPDRYVDTELNEWDEYALEVGVQLVESGIAEEVVTVTIGPEQVEETIRKGLAKGADRARRIWDDALETTGTIDSQTKAQLLTAVVADESPDLVLTGVQSSDSMFAATGVSLAHKAGYGWAAVVNTLDVDPDEGVAHVHRELEGGLEELTTVDLPAVCTIQTGINEPRYASLRGIRMAQQSTIETDSLESLGLDASMLDSAVEERDVRKPVVESSAEMLEGSASETATQLADILVERGVGQ